MTHKPFNKAVRHHTKSFDTVVTAERGDSLEARFFDSNGRPAPSISLDSFHSGMAKTYTGYVGIAQDLQEASDALARFQDLPDDDYTMRRSLIVTAIVSYARCFAQGDGRGVKLDARRPWISQEGDQRRWHKLLIEMRNQLFAHAGQSPFRKIEAAILVNSLTDIERVDGIAWLQFGFVAFSSSDIDQIREHILRLSTLVDEKIHLQSDKILECARRELVSK